LIDLPVIWLPWRQRLFHLFIIIDKFSISEFGKPIALKIKQGWLNAVHQLKKGRNQDEKIFYHSHCPDVCPWLDG
jgi:hypothetical protein